MKTELVEGEEQNNAAEEIIYGLSTSTLKPQCWGFFMLVMSVI